MLIPSGRVMLSANVIGDAKAHHQIRHRARHGLRGGVASPPQRFALVVPRRRPRRPRQRPRQQSCHGLCFQPGALAPSMRHTHRTNAWCRLVRRVTPMNRGSMVSSIRLRKPGRSTLLLLRANPRRRMAALWKARARERQAVSAPSHGPRLTAPVHRPVDPGSDPECVIFAHSENALRIMPPIGGQMPPRKPCRHVAASQTRARPPP